MNFSDHFVELNLYKIKKTGKLLRILRISDNNEDIIAIEFNDKGHAAKMPRSYDAMSIWQRIEKGELILQEDEEDKFLKGDSPISESEERRIEKLSDIFLPLLEDPRIFYARSRNKLVKKLIERYPNYKKNVYRKLKEYWIGGCTPNAWISQFARCGGAGKIRAAGINKRGRKKKDKDAPVGINVDKKERAWIQAGIKKHKGLSIDETYNAIVGEHYGKNVKGKIVVDWALAFTIGQFKSWRKKLISASNLLKNEIGQKEFDLSERPKRGSANKNVFGIGSCYQTSVQNLLQY
jgi:putative transposase